MISKKIPFTSKKTRASHVRDLTDYILRANRADESVLHVGADNFIFEQSDIRLHQHEMVALAEEGVRSPNPMTHWLLSWREGEQPTPEQADQAARLLLKELGMQDHQAIWAVHQDTHNVHLHLAINRVHPETYKLANERLDYVSASRAVAQIEHLQGWQSERRARFEIDAKGEVVRRPYEAQAPVTVPNARRDMEQFTGEKSALRQAKEEAPKLMREARSWSDLHTSLAARGMRYEKTGSGATIFVGEVGVKASSVDRQSSLTKLEARLGAYTPRDPKLVVAPRDTAQPLVKHTSPQWERYRAEQLDARKVFKAHQQQLRELHQKQRDALRATQRAERDHTFKGRDWQGAGLARDALRSVLGAEHAKQKLDLKDRQQQQRDRLRAARKTPSMSFEQWLREQQTSRGPDHASAWRWRESEPGMIGPGTRSAEDLRAYSAQLRPGSRSVSYVRESAQPGAPASFVDFGPRVDVHELRADSVLAAMQLGAQKHGGKISISGTEAFEKLAIELAVRHRITITNPELQPAIQAEQARQRDELGAPSRTDATSTRFIEARAPEAQKLDGPLQGKALYDMHRQHTVAIEGNQADTSRIDALIASRLRVTGHSQAEVIQLVAAHSPTTHQDREAYARRCVDYAWGKGGELDAERARYQVVSLREHEGLNPRGRSRDLGERER